MKHEKKEPEDDYWHFEYVGFMLDWILKNEERTAFDENAYGECQEFKD